MKKDVFIWPLTLSILLDENKMKKVTKKPRKINFSWFLIFL